MVVMDGHSPVISDLQELTERLRSSLREQERALRASLILNPVENFPLRDDLAVSSGLLHGLYNSDKVRSREQREQTDMQFAGRQALEADCRAIYAAWAEALGAADATLRVLSGLHAHIVLFMALARPGETLLLLPVEAGGHVSGRDILERLGLVVTEMVVDTAGECVDVEATLARCVDKAPDYVLVDRSEGLVVEDFAELAAVARRKAIFDSSQYLTHVICGDHPNPFERNFDLMIASVHKNFPGPQKALLATRERDEMWQQTLAGVSTYVSNMHVASTYTAGLTLARTEWLSDYSRRMLDVAVLLESELAERGVPVVRRRTDLPPTHHVWIREGEKPRAFETFERLEQCRIMTNYRKLPYSLGHGIRIGVNAAVRLGLTVDEVPELAELIAQIRRRGATRELKQWASAFSETIWERA